jgi:GTP cyclohydrolase I
MIQKHDTIKEAWSKETNLWDLLAPYEDMDREGLQDTPKRFRKAFQELTSGYEADTDKILSATFEAESAATQVVRDIEFTSLCEHHLMPFYGFIHVGYRPNHYVVGLSKIARLVEACSRRLQIQERLVEHIADALWQRIDPLEVMVICRARHLCTKSRGIKKPDMFFISCAERGETSPELRQLLMEKTEL